jgi:hypothetical protein
VVDFTEKNFPELLLKASCSPKPDGQRHEHMIEKVITVTTLNYDTALDDLRYWLSRPPEERLEAVDVLRQRIFDLPAKMERVLEVAELDYD